MRFEILGPVRVRVGPGEVLVSGRERLLLATLLVHANQPVEVARLVEAVWGDSPPRQARNQVQTCVSRLRKALSAAGGPDHPVVVTDPSGYRISVDATSLDLLEFHQVLAEARAAAGQGRHPAARDGYRAALSLWRGPALAGVDSDHLRKAAIALDEERVRALEERIKVELALGGGGELVAELTGLVSQHPYRESLHSALLVALFRAGRQADALAAYQRARQLLVEEVGTEPGAELRRLHQRILVGDQTLVAGAGEAGEPGAGEGVFPARHSLPRAVADFTGRREEVARLVKAAHSDSGALTVVAVDGMAGVGKTTLVVQVAHQLAEAFPDAQLYLDLHGHSERRPVEPAAALDTLLRQLGVPGGRIPAGWEDRAALWRSELATRRALVVLDNAASTAQVAPLLPAGPGCLVLVTSRRRLTGLDAARPLALEPLSTEEAVGLLARVAGDRVRDEPEAAMRVVQRCGYLPLAIRLAGARLAHRRSWRVQDLVDRLQDAGGLLAELAAEERTVADAFALSYAPLAPADQRVFRLLGLHPGRDFDGYAVAALADASVADAQRSLDELVDRHLVEELRLGRYRLHDLVGQYASQLVAATEPEPERTAAVERLLDFYLHTAAMTSIPLYEVSNRWHARFGRPQRLDLVNGAGRQGTAWLDVEHPNLVAGVRCARELSLDRYAWQLALAAWRFLYLGGYTDNLLATLRDGLSAAEQLGDVYGIAVMLTYLASGHYHVGDYDVAIGQLQRALELWRESSDQAGEAATLMNLATVLDRLGRQSEAVRLHEQSLSIRRRIGDLASIGILLSNLGNVYAELGRHRDSLRCHRLRLTIATETRDLFGRVRAVGNLGIARVRAGQHRPAVRLLTAAVILTRKVRHPLATADCLNWLGCAYRELGRHDEAVARHREALAVTKEIGDGPGECAVRNSLGVTLRATGEVTAALAEHRTALAEAVRIRLKYEHARALDGIAACLASTEPDSARRHWEQAHRLYTEMGVPEQAEVERQLGMLRNTRRALSTAPSGPGS